jgi:hypothetical protein
MMMLARNRRWRFIAGGAAALVALGVSATVAQQSAFVGRWNITGTGADADKVYFLEVTQSGDRLEGRFLNRVAHATPLAWIRIEGNELVFQYGRGEGGPTGSPSGRRRTPTRTTPTVNRLCSSDPA